MKRFERVLLGEDRDGENLYECCSMAKCLHLITHPEQCPQTHAGNVNEWESYSEKHCLVKRPHVFNAVVSVVSHLYLTV